MNFVTRFGLAASAFGLAALVHAGPAGAHVTPDRDEVPAGGFTAVTLTVPHGCDGSATTAVDIQIPGAIADVTPAVVAGWDVAVETEGLAEPIDGSHGEAITERESVVTYTAQPGNELPDGFRQSFTLGFQAPDAPGEHLFFKTVQRCVGGELAWIEEYTGEGEEPEHPAPVLLVTEGDGGGHGASDDDAGEVVTEQAAAVDDDDDDAVGLAVAGLVVGAAGLVAGGTALVKGRKTT